MRFKVRGRALAPSVAALVFLAGCGTRVSDAQVEQAAGEGQVTLAQESLDQLRALGARSSATASGTAPSSAQKAPQPPSAASGSVATSNPGAAALSHSAGQPRSDAAATKSKDKKPAPPAPGASVPAKLSASGAEGCAAKLPPIVIGQIGSFSGVTGPITASARTALAVWAKWVNAHGGLDCHPVVLYSVDDGADPSRAQAAVQELVGRGAQALVGVFSTISIKGIIDGAQKMKVPVVGGDAAGIEWNESPFLFPQGATVRGQIAGAVRQSVNAGQKKAGLLYCVEASVCTNAAKLIPDAYKAAGGDLVYSAPVTLTQTEFTAQCQNAKNAGAKALVVAVDGSAIGRIARSCAALQYHPQFITSALVISQNQASDPSVRENTIATAVPNAPWMRDDTPGQREYHQAMKTYAPESALDANSMGAWASGKLLAAAIQRIAATTGSAPITSRLVLDGLGKLKNETLDGLAPPITFKPDQEGAPSLNCAYFALLNKDGWSAPQASKPDCQGDVHIDRLPAVSKSEWTVATAHASGRPEL